MSSSAITPFSSNSASPAPGGVTETGSGSPPMSGAIERHSSSSRSAATSSPSQFGPPSQSTTRWPRSASARIAAAGSTRSSPATMTSATSSAWARRSGSAAAQVITWVRASSGASANAFAAQSNARDRLTTASGGVGDWPCLAALCLGRLVETHRIRTPRGAPSPHPPARCPRSAASCGTASWSGLVDREPTRPSTDAVPSSPATMCPVTQHSCRGRDRSTARYGPSASGTSAPRSSSCTQSP